MGRGFDGVDISGGLGNDGTRDGVTDGTSEGVNDGGNVGDALTIT